LLVTCLWSLGAGCSSLATGLGLISACTWELFKGHFDIMNENKFLSSSNPDPGTRCMGPGTRGRRPVTGERRPATSSQPPVTRNGFTLLEVMVAMAIMAIVLVSVYRMHSQTLAMNTANRFYTLAPMLAQSKLTQLETGSSEIISGDSGDFGDKFPGYSWNVSTEEVAIAALGEVANDFKRINLSVSFNGNEYVYNVRTYRLMRE
jgi:general secretion pathway protein I